MAEMIDGESGQLESTTIGVFRSSATVKGGKRFSFGALVAVGDRRGRVALGYAKAKEVPPAIEKAQKDGKKHLQRYVLQGRTIPHIVEGRFSSSSVRLIPASPGTGIVAGATVRAVLELVGITDCLTKAYGSTNQKNLAKATLEGLSQLRTRDSVAGLRGVAIEKTQVDVMLEGSTASSAPTPSPERTRGPAGRGRDGGERRGGRGGPQGDRGGRGGGGPGRGGPRGRGRGGQDSSGGRPAVG